MSSTLFKTIFAGVVTAGALLLPLSAAQASVKHIPCDGPSVSDESFFDDGIGFYHNSSLDLFDDDISFADDISFGDYHRPHHHKPVVIKHHHHKPTKGGYGTEPATNDGYGKPSKGGTKPATNDGYTKPTKGGTKPATNDGYTKGGTKPATNDGYSKPAKKA